MYSETIQIALTILSYDINHVVIDYINLNKIIVFQCKIASSNIIFKWIKKTYMAGAGENIPNSQGASTATTLDLASYQLQLNLKSIKFILM